jgi:hypothetical protein
MRLPRDRGGGATEPDRGTQRHERDPLLRFAHHRETGNVEEQRAIHRADRPRVAVCEQSPDRGRDRARARAREASAARSSREHESAARERDDAARDERERDAEIVARARHHDAPEPMLRKYAE